MPPEDTIPDIDDITPPLEIPEAADPTMWILIGVALLILLIIAIVTMTRSPKLRSAKQAYNARKSALDKLHHLKENVTSTEPAQCALVSTEALKEYLFNYHDPASPYSTTAEITESLRKKDTDEATLEKIAELLTQADALKYARSDSDINARLPLVEAAIQFIRDDKSTPQSVEPSEEPESDQKAFT